MQPGNIRNHYFEKYIHSMVLNLLEMSSPFFFIRKKPGGILIFGIFLAKIQFWSIFHWKSAIWAKSAIMTSL